MGLTLDDLGGYDSDTTLTVVRAWLSKVLSGEVIRATGGQNCGLGLLLYGPPGTGKTTLACAIAQDLIRDASREVWASGEVRLERPVLFATYPRILQTLKREMDGDDDASALYRAMAGDDPKTAVRVLVIDDLGKEYRTVNGWSEVMFDHLLRSRFDAGWPTVVTTNVPLRDWDRVYGEAMGSFAHEAFTTLAIMAVVGDRRRS